MSSQLFGMQRQKHTTNDSSCPFSSNIMHVGIYCNWADSAHTHLIKTSKGAWPPRGHECADHLQPGFPSGGAGWRGGYYDFQVQNCMRRRYRGHELSERCSKKYKLNRWVTGWWSKFRERESELRCRDLTPVRKEGVQEQGKCQRPCG